MISVALQQTPICAHCNFLVQYVMERHDCLMINIFILCGAFIVICGGSLIICGAYVIICGGFRCICGAFFIICGARFIICGKMNSNGLMLLEFCTRLQLSVMGTMFQLKDSLKNTWQHLRSKHWHQLDHVLANQAAKPFIKVTKVNQAADCFTDHKLLVSNCALPLKRKKNISRPPKKLNTRLNDDKKAKLVQFLNEKIPASSFDFEELQDILQQAANHVFEKKKRIQNDWFDDQDDEIRNLLQDKSLDRHSLRTRIRQIKDAWFQKKAEEAEHFSQTKNPREFYATLNAVYGPRSRNSHPVSLKRWHSFGRSYGSQG